jgi:hypothetical protein
VLELGCAANPAGGFSSFRVKTLVFRRSESNNVCKNSLLKRANKKKKTASAHDTLFFSESCLFISLLIRLFS